MKVNFELFETLNNELGLISEISLVGDSKKEYFFLVNLKNNPLKIEATSKNVILKKFLSEN